MAEPYRGLNEALARTRPAGEDVEEMAEVMCADDHEHCGYAAWADTPEGIREYHRGHARAILASDWLAAHDAQVAAAAEAAAGERIAAAILRETCREWPKDGDRCNAPAEFILWGKLFPPEALGPRCFDHAVKHAGDDMTRRTDQWAVFDLRVQSVLARIARADRGSDRPTMAQADCRCPDDCECDGRFACEAHPTGPGIKGSWTCELVAGHDGWHQSGGHRWEAS